MATKFRFNPFSGNLDAVSVELPAGSDTQVQFNDGGNFGADSGLTFNKATDALSAGAFVPSSATAPANGLYLPAANSVALSTGSSERLRIDSSGRLLVGTSSDSTGGLLQVRTSSTGNRNLSLRSDQASLGYPFIQYFDRSANNAAVPNNESLGYILFRGYDGSALISSAGITAEVDGTPGTNDMPGRLVFSTTADGASSPTERLRITSTGQLRLAGAGITFNGDTATANELDDYEEGTFTPTILGSSTTGTVTYAIQSGIYTKVGRAVSYSIYLNYSGGTGTGNLWIGGLPFTTNNAYYSACFSLFDNIALAANNVVGGYTNANTTNIIVISNTVGGAAYANVAYDAAGQFIVSGTYFTA